MGCGCKGNKPKVTPTNTTTTTTTNQLDEQRVSQIKNEIRSIVNKYYTKK